MPSLNSAKKPNINFENKKFNIDTDVNKNLMENIKRAQTPLISDHTKISREISNRYSNNKNNYEISDLYKNNINVNNNNSIRRPVSSTIIQSGKGIIDGRKTEINNNYNNNYNNKRSIDINNNMNNNLYNNDFNIGNKIKEEYPKYKLGDYYNEINNNINNNEEENTIKNNKYMNYNNSNRNINNNYNINSNKQIKSNENDNFNFEQTLFNRGKFNINNNTNNNLNNNNNINNYDFTFKNQEEESQEKPFMISESLRGGSIEKILDLNNKINISRDFENKNKEEEDNNNNYTNNNTNLFETFGPINNNSIKVSNNTTQSNKNNFDSINSNFTFGNKNNKNILEVDNIIKNINMGALNYFSKYENNNEENNNINNNSINNNKNVNENNLEESMKSFSKLISPSNKTNLLSTWKKDNNNEDIKEEIYNENEKEEKEEKEFTFNNNNKDLYITFGEVPKDSIKLDNSLNNQNNDINNDINKNTLKNPLDDDYLESEGICNFYKETKKIKKEDISNQVNEALLDAKESSDEEDNKKEEINKINFFEETLQKIKKKKSNDIINKNDRQQLDMIISGEIEDIDTFKSGDNYKNK